MCLIRTAICGFAAANFGLTANSKAAALAQGILGKDVDKTFVMAHGTGTPQNRVTESHILNEVAKTGRWV